MKNFRVVLYGGAMCEEPIASNIIKEIVTSSDMVEHVQWISVLEDGDMTSPFCRKAKTPNGDIFIDFGPWSRFVWISEIKA